MTQTGEGPSRAWDAWGLFERFTERGRRVVVLAHEEARGLKHNYIGTEHILLGLLREQEGLAARVLESLDITVERVREQVVQIVGPGEEATTGQIPFTPRAKKVLELANREALSLGHYIGTEHVLLGLLRESEGVAVRILLDLNADAEKIRASTIALVSRSAVSPGGAQEVKDATRPTINRETGRKYLLCSFCGKTQEQVERLIAGPGGVYICNECVELCAQVLAEEREQAKRSDPAEPGAT